MWFFLDDFYLQWIVTKTLSVTSFSSRLFHVPRYNHLSPNVFMNLFNVDFLTTYLFPSRLGVSIICVSLVVTCTDSVWHDYYGCTVNNLHWVSYFSRGLISCIYFPWIVMNKKYFSWSVMKSHHLLIFVCQLMIVKRRHRKHGSDLHERHRHRLCFFVRDALDMGYQSGHDVMGSLLRLVTHMQTLSYKWYVYIKKSIGYTINWEYIQQYSIILTNYLVKAIAHLVDVMSKQDRQWFVLLSKYELTRHLKHFRMKWVYVTLYFVLLRLLWWFKKKHSLDQFIKNANGIWDFCEFSMWLLYILIIPIDVNI